MFTSAPTNFSVLIRFILLISLDIFSSDIYCPTVRQLFLMTPFNAAEYLMANLTFFRFVLVETVPDGLVYAENATGYQSIYNSWMDLIKMANHSLDIAAFYWTLTGSDVNVTDPTSKYVSKHSFPFAVCLPTFNAWF